VATGYRLRGVSEPFLLACWGDVPLSHLPAPAGHLESWEEACGAPVIDGVVRGHSRKPDDQYALVETIAPAGPGAELFARQPWPGWAAWGNEVGKFAAEGVP
jgi:N6-adenosine-specific RNA methylase IME4